MPAEIGRRRKIEMNTRVPTSTASTDLELGWSATLSSIHFEAAALLLICAALTVGGAFLTFPLYDDGWLALVLRESGRHSLAQNMGDRPVFGFLLEWTASFGAANKYVFVILNAVLWLGFAIESGMLFRKLFPEFKNYAIVAACLTLAPIVLLRLQLVYGIGCDVPANLATMSSATQGFSFSCQMRTRTNPLVLGILASQRRSQCLALRLASTGLLRIWSGV